VLELITAGDVDAAAGFYDGRAPSVHEYLVQLCSSELVDEATLAAFVDFRGRAASVPPDADADEVLRRAARTTAAARLDLRDARSAECRATAELLVARMNGELARSEEPLEQHLKHCSTCRWTAERLTDADSTLTGRGGDAPPDDIRVAWLELVGPEELTALDEVAAGGNRAGPEQAESIAEDRQAPEPAPVAAEEPTTVQPESPDKQPADQLEPPGAFRVRARRGGLLGAARRLASSTRRHQ
jgi:hypothetical protein